MSKQIVINEIEYSVYADESDADNYFNAKFGSTWQDIADDDKKKLLVTATLEIDKNQFIGHRQDIEQDLKFPRKYIDCLINPEKELMICCCEVANAIYLAGDNTTIAPNADKIKSMSVGDTSITYRDGVTIDSDVYSSLATPIVEKYLYKWLKGNLRVIL